MISQPLFWKIHFACWIVIVSWQFVSGRLLYLLHTGPLQIVLFVISTIPFFVITVGLYGHAWRKPALTLFVWKMMFFIMLVDTSLGIINFSLGRHFGIDFQLGLPGILYYYPYYLKLLFDLFIILVLSILPVVGLFRYAWRSDTIGWKRDQSNDDSVFLNTILVILITIGLLRNIFRLFLL